MSDRLEVHVVQAKHHLVDDIGGLSFSKAVDLDESLEELASFNDFWDDIIVLLIFQQVYYSDNVWMRFLSEDGQLILEQLYILVGVYHM